MFGAEVDVDDAFAFVRRANGQIFVAILVDVSEISQRESKSECFIFSEEERQTHRVNNNDIGFLVERKREKKNSRKTR